MLLLRTLREGGLVEQSGLDSSLVSCVNIMVLKSYISFPVVSSTGSIVYTRIPFDAIRPPEFFTDRQLTIDIIGDDMFRRKRILHSLSRGDVPKKNDDVTPKKNDVAPKKGDVSFVDAIRRFFHI